MKGYAVVDVFAGPGGLGEGFSSARREMGNGRFRSVVSIERDTYSHQTLLMRHFFRHLSEEGVLGDYYDFLKGDIAVSRLFERQSKAYTEAEKSVHKISLGPESHDQVRKLIQGRLKGDDLWVLVGGPPCQAYSLVGRSRMQGRAGFHEDERHTLYLEYLRIIADHHPPVFVMENVKGLLSATIDGESTISRIVRDLSRPRTALPDAPADLGYKLYSLTEEEMPGGEVDPRLFVVRAEDYGVPQARHRMFIVGIRRGLKVRPSILKKSLAPTVRETIGSLPPLRSSLSKEVDSISAWRQVIREISDIGIRGSSADDSRMVQLWSDLEEESINKLPFPGSCSDTRYEARATGSGALKTVINERLPVLTAHHARGHMASDFRRYFFAANFARIFGRSTRLGDFPEQLLPGHKNVEEGRTGKMFADRFRVQLADQVSTTITSHISKDGHYFIHYDPAQCRSLTVREAARLQTFPDNYHFAGPRTAQFHQVGNAVPPYLAGQIADIIGDVLDEIKASR
jgi:DNA (cytosine-5)-methyltransferase 1